MFEIKVPKEQAEKEVNSWLDYKRVKPGAREAKQGNIDVLVEAVMYGDITIDPVSFKITHNLNFPIKDDKGEVAVDKLQYVARLNLDNVQTSVQSTDGLTKGFGTALTGQPVAIIGKLDSCDAQILSSIGVFFTS
jgi:hypothetical protein